MGEHKTKDQNNYGWTLTWEAAGRYPIVAKRRFKTLADAQQFVDDTSPTASATEGLIIAVFADAVEKNNGIYYVAKVANTDPSYGAVASKGELIKAGSGNGSLSVASLTVNAGKVAEATNDNVGQIIFVTTGDSTYPKGPYIVTGDGTVSNLSTSGDIEAIKSNIKSISERLQNTNDKVTLTKNKAEASAVGVRLEYGEAISSVNDSVVTIDYEIYTELQNGMMPVIQKVEVLNGEEVLASNEDGEAKGKLSLPGGIYEVGKNVLDFRITFTTGLVHIQKFSVYCFDMIISGGVEGGRENVALKVESLPGAGKNRSCFLQAVTHPGENLIIETRAVEVHCIKSNGFVIPMRELDSNKLISASAINAGTILNVEILYSLL